MTRALPVLCSALAFCTLLASSGISAQTIGATRFRMTVNGQVAMTNADGSFRVSNIPAVDQFPADLQSDAWLAVTGFSTEGGVTLYAYSTPFRLTQGQTFLVPHGSLVVSTVPPLISASLAVSIDQPQIDVAGGTAQLTVTALLSDGTQVDATPASTLTSYLSSNTSVAQIDADGGVTAIGVGNAVLRATNEGVTGAASVRVVSATVSTTVVGIVQLPDGTPAAGANVETTEGGATVAAADGSFAIPITLPTGTGIAVLADIVVGSLSFVGGSDPTGVFPDGFTDVGIVVLQPGLIGSLFGNPLVQVGAGLGAVAEGDLDGDGRPDLGVANQADGSMSILLNDGDGVHSLHQTFSVGSSPSALLFVDVDGDGDRDLAVANQGSNDVWVLRNDGTGTFGSATSHAVGSAPISIATGDFDLGGGADLVVANSGDGTVSVLLNVGGTFGTGVPSTVGGTPSSVVAGLLDGDAFPDLAVGDSTPGGNVANVLINNGLGGFPTSVPYGAGQGCAGLALEDLDLDGDFDLAAASDDSIAGDAAVVLLNNGNGTFPPSAAGLAFAAGVDPRSIDAGDMTGDGVPDLAVANHTGNGGTSILVGDGLGGFGPAATFDVSGRESASIVLADFDGDAALDAAVAFRASDFVAILFGRGDGSFLIPGSDGTGVSPQSMALGDLDGDTIPDMVVTNNGSNDVSVFLNNGDGTFGAPTLISVGSAPKPVVLGDFDFDADLDMAVANSGGGDVWIFFNDGFGNLTFQSAHAVGTNPWTLQAEDLDGDADLDLSLLNLSSVDITVLINDGTGSFSPQGPFGLPAFLPGHMVGGDLDGDTFPDLAVVGGGLFTPDQLVVLLNDGAGNFAMQPPILLTLGSQPLFLAMEDLDLDADLDLTIVNGSSGDLSLFFNDGSGGLTGPSSVPVPGNGPASVVVRDVDFDADPDLVVTHQVGGIFGDGILTLFANDGAGTFTQTQSFGGGDVGQLVVAGDLEMDGDPDLAVVIASTSAPAIWTYLHLAIP